MVNDRQVRGHLQLWYNMRLRGRQGYPMHRCPFTLIRTTVTTLDGRPLWLAFFGPRRQVWAPSSSMRPIANASTRSTCTTSSPNTYSPWLTKPPILTTRNAGGAWLSWRTTNSGRPVPWLKPVGAPGKNTWPRSTPHPRRGSYPSPSSSKISMNFAADWHSCPAPQTPRKTPRTGSRTALQTATTLQNRL